MVFPMAHTKSKRDEFLIEIRKKKSQMILLKKRMKLYGNSVDRPTSMQEEIFGYPENNNSIVEETPTLSEDTKNKLREAYERFYENLNNNNFENLIPIIGFLRECIADKEDSIPGKTIIEMGIVPSLLDLLSVAYVKHEELQVQVAWLLANISAGNSQDTMHLVGLGIIPVISKSLKATNNEDLHENEMWCLANICGENNLKLRDEIIEQGVLNLVVRELCKTPKKVLYYRTAAWLISNLVRGTPYPSYDKIEKCFSALTHLIDYKDNTIQQHTLLSLIFLSEEARDDNIKGIMDNSLIPKILNHIGNEDDKISINALKVTGNIAKGSKYLTHNLCGHELFKSLPRALTSLNPLLRKEACNTLGNILIDGFDDHDYITDFDILYNLIDIIQHDQEEIKVPATYCLFKFLQGCPQEDALKSIDRGVVVILLNNLRSLNTTLIDYSLQALYKILEHGDNVGSQDQQINPLVWEIVQNNLHLVFEELHQHQDDNISLKVEVLVKRFFNTEWQN